MRSALPWLRWGTPDGYGLLAFVHLKFRVTKAMPSVQVGDAARSSTVRNSKPPAPRRVRAMPTW